MPANRLTPSPPASIRRLQRWFHKGKQVRRMISSMVFIREMKRITQSDQATGALGLHVPQWMFIDGKMNEDTLRALFGELTKRLHTEQQMIDFANWMLKSNASGQIRYFPKQSEMRNYLLQFLEENPPPRPAPRAIEHGWMPAVEDPFVVRLRLEVIEWWAKLDEQTRDEVRTKIVQHLTETDQLFTATYIEEKIEGWKYPQASPMVLTELVLYYEKTFTQKRRHEPTGNVEAS